MVKHIILLIISIFIFHNNIFAIEVSLPDITVKGGTSVSVPVMVTDLTGKGVYGFELCVGFDKDILKATGATRSGTLSSGFMVVQNTNFEGQIIVAAASTNAITGEGVLVYLNFIVSPWVSESTMLYFRKQDSGRPGFMFNAGVPATPKKNGSLKVEEKIIDLNNLPDIDIIENSTDNSLVLNNYLQGENIDSSQISWSYLDNANIDTFYSSNSTVVFSPPKDSVGEEEIVFSCAYLGFTKYDTISLTVMRQSEINEPTVFNLSSNTNILPCLFPDGNRLKIKFKSGSFAGQQLTLTAFGDEIPGSIVNVPSLESVVDYFSIESEIDSFSASLSFGYTEENLVNSNINENDLVIAFFDTLNYQWKSLLTTVYPDRKIITAEIDHFSLWSLADKNDVLIVGIENEEINAEIPLSFKLYQNYPNPFNPQTTIEFVLPRSTDVILKVYNILGQEVRTLVNRKMYTGNHLIIWDGNNNYGTLVSSGIYIYVLKAGDFVMSRKMILMR